MSLSITVIPVTALQENCTLLICEATNKATFVDPGGDSARLIEALEEKGATLEQILITHGHGDHIGGVAALKDRYGVPVVGPHEGDADMIRRAADQRVRIGLDEGEAFTVDRWLNDGDQVQVGEETLSVLHVPGHTRGSVAYYHAPAQLALVGDVLFAGSIGRTDLPGGDYATLIASIKTKLLPLGDDVIFIPGHGPDSTMGRERQSNPFLRRG